jgi:RNA polymerase subunit RPABC4/transcription elongation factor Spt4
VSFGPTALRGFTAPGSGGRVEYLLARNAVVKDFHKGRLSRLDVCDAHPELIRAARNVGIPLDQTCPICEDEMLVQVTYVFGPRLPPNGRCPATVAELEKLCRRKEELVCYAVEVCPECRWNHLTRSYAAGAAARARSRALKS